METKEEFKLRFMAMSKLIGLVAFFFVFIITVYAMIEMHRSCDYSSMPQLIISAFTFASIYSGFYLVMAKIEHVEKEKTYREHKLEKLRSSNADPELIEEQRIRLENIEQRLNNLYDDETHTLM